MIEMGQRVANGDDVLAMSHRQHVRKSGEPCVLLGLRGDPVARFYDYDQFHPDLIASVAPLSGSRPCKKALELFFPGHRHKSRGKVRNIFRKIKKYIRKSLSPASVDKSVNKVAPPPKYRAFLNLQDVFA